MSKGGLRASAKTLAMAIGVVAAYSAGAGAGAADAPAPAGALTCAGCHGQDGAAPGTTIPIIGGQRADYLAAALKAYKADERKFYVMKLIAKGFSDDALAAMAAWFGARPWVATETAHDPTKAAAGAALAGAVCAACHGAKGEGGEGVPRLAGQPAAYLVDAIDAYRQGTRAAPAPSMAALTALDAAAVEALAHYYAGL